MAHGRSWVAFRSNRQWVEHSARTSVAAIASLLVARFFGLPEAYWAAITTLIVMQSTLGAALTVSSQNFAGTALGAAFGALLATYFGPNVIVFGAGVFVMGLLCALLHLERNAYRFAGITLAIVMLLTRAQPAWLVAAHRFVEVSVGIAAGLVLTALWPERVQRRPSSWAESRDDPELARASGRHPPASRSLRPRTHLALLTSSAKGSDASDGRG